MQKYLRVFAIILILLSSTHAHAECPPGVDPTYCRVAEDTGGTVFTSSGELTDYIKQEAERALWSERFYRLNSDILNAGLYLPIFVPFLVLLLLSYFPISRSKAAMLYGIGCTVPSFVLSSLMSTGITTSSLFRILILLAFILGTFFAYVTNRNRTLLIVWCLICGLLPYAPIRFAIAIH
jgi:hypothetical protein